MPADTTLWNHCVHDLKAELPEQQFNTWIRPLQAVESDADLRLLAPNRFVVDWLREHYLARIVDIVEGTGSNKSVIVEVGSREAAPGLASRAGGAAAAAAPARPAEPALLASRLNPAFTFASFVEGKSNQLARAAASI